MRGGDLSGRAKGWRGGLQGVPCRPVLMVRWATGWEGRDENMKVTSHAENCKRAKEGRGGEEDGEMSPAFEVLL